MAAEQNEQPDVVVSRIAETVTIETVSITAQAPSHKAALDEHNTASKKRHPLFWQIMDGIGLCIVLTVLAYLIDHTFTGQQFEMFSYRVLQGQLKPGTPVVTIVDIGDMDPEPVVTRGVPPGKEERVTPRNKLEWILQAVSRHEPSAIGVDIDFSPELTDGQLQYEKNGGLQYLTSKDPDFFRFCESLKPGLPVYLGIYRTELLPPDQWLGDPAWKGLAAALWMRYVPREAVRSLARSQDTDDHKNAAPTMSFALANAFRDYSVRESDAQTRSELSLHSFGRVLRALLFAKERAAPVLEDQEDDDTGVHLKLDQSYVDYSLLRSQSQTFPIIKLPPSALDAERTVSAVIDSRAEDISGHIVLVGDVSNPTDVFPNPALGTTVPGVEIQAAAANTLASGPLYSFPEWTKYTLDFLMAVTILLLWTWIKEKQPHLDESHLLTVMIALSAVFVVTTALLVNVTHIVWGDFLFIAIGLLIHPVTHRTWHRMRHHMGLALGDYLKKNGNEA